MTFLATVLVLNLASALMPPVDFSGRWELVANRSEPGGAFGRSATILHADGVISVTYSVAVPRGRGTARTGAASAGLPGSDRIETVRWLFRVDREETNHTNLGSSRSFDKARLVGDKLVIETYEASGVGVFLGRERTCWIDADGALVVSTVVKHPGGRSGTASLSVYRRVTV